MATTTVVCPQCGAPAGPGRFACPDCGALLASLGAAPKPARPATRRAPRRSASAGAAADPVEDTSESPAEELAFDPDDEPLDAAEPAVDAPEAADEPQWHTAAAQPEWPAAAAQPEWPTAPAAPQWPTAAVEPQWPTAPVEPQWPTAAPEPQWPTAPPEPQWSRAPVTPDWRGPAAEPEPSVAPEQQEEAEPQDLPAAPAAPEPAPVPAAAQPAMAPPPDLPIWPPAGGVAPLPPPAVRTPAGAYLAPSAVLPPLDAPNAASGHHAGSASDAGAVAVGKPRVASLSETLDALGITGDVPRRVIGSGAAVAALGFLLPWAEVVIGSGQAGSYWARWGMAGPGHWIVVAGLVALTVLGLARAGRLSELPLGVPAVGLGALLVGIVWPYLFGIIGHSIGVWLVLVGALILTAGGLLDLRRHASATPDV